MTAQLNPDDFIITRKRKLYKFALFANSPLCFEIDDWQNTPPTQIMELGAGTGLFSVALAAMSPSIQVVAVDVKADRLQTGAAQSSERQLTNIHFVRARADQLTDHVTHHSLQAIWLTFPDPFPRERSAKHRLTHERYLAVYEQLLQPGGVIYFKHDNLAFFCWTLEQLVARGWTIQELSFDLHASNLSDEYKVLTTYERRWLSQGLVTLFVKAVPPSV